MDFTDEQLAFIDSGSARLLLEAPAGTGKTETVAERVRRGVLAGKNIQLTCFTNASRRTLEKRLDDAGLNVPVRTVVSLAYELLVAEYGDSFEVGDGSDIAREVCARTPVRPAQLLQMEALMVNRAPLPQSLPAVVGEVWDAYNTQKAEREYLTFADVVLASTGLRSYGWDELIVDEAQDIQPIQMDMLRSFDPVAMTLVGDSGQAIYGFSGVDADLLPRLAREGWDALGLSSSWRVPAALLPVVNAGRVVPLTSMRSGGSVRVLRSSYADAAALLEPLLEPGDAVVGSTVRQLNRVASRVELLRPGVPVSRSWAETGVPGSIHFSTVHSAKGGEWRRVYLLDCGPAGLWSPMTVDVAEQRRLFYVAASRAVDELVLVQTGDSLPFGLEVA